MKGHPFCVLMDIAKDETVHPRFFKSNNYTKLMIKTSTHYSGQMYLVPHPCSEPRCEPSPLWRIDTTHDGCVQTLPQHYRWDLLAAYYMQNILNFIMCTVYLSLSIWPPILHLAHSNSVNNMFSFRKLRERCMW